MEQSRGTARWEVIPCLATLLPEVVLGDPRLPAGVPMVVLGVAVASGYGMEGIGCFLAGVGLVYLDF